MHLYLLRPIDENAHPWYPWYDKNFGFVVRAIDEMDARIRAAIQAGVEGGAAWLNRELSICIELEPDGEAGVIIRDFASA